MKKRVIGIVAISLALVGCSNSEVNNEKVKMGKVMQDSHKTISYRVDSSEDDSRLTKDATIDSYIVSENGKITVYNDNDDTKIGKIARMDEDKLDNYMKKQDQQYFEDDKQKTTQNIKDYKDKATKSNKSLQDNYNDYLKMNSKDQKKFLSNVNASESEIKDKIEENDTFIKKCEKLISDYNKTKYTDPKPRDMKIKVTTDGSGNNTETERINIGTRYFDTDSENGIYKKDSEAKKSYLPFTNVENTTDIYDKKYVGINDMNYADENGYENEYSYLITEAGDKAEGGVLDSPKDKNVTIDEED